MAATDNSSCQELRELVANYIAETLPLPERERFEVHLAGCVGCRDYLARMEDGAHLSCQELVELVTEYLEGTLPLAERERFEAHLTLCPGCRNYLEQMRETIRLAGKLDEETIPAPARQELLKAFRAWKRG